MDPLLLIALGVYLLPTVIAYARKHERRKAILVLDILLGWTILAWLAGLIWACRGISNAAAPPKTKSLLLVGPSQEGSEASARPEEEAFETIFQDGKPPRCDFCGVELSRDMYADPVWRDGFVSFGLCPECYLLCVLYGTENLHG